MAGEEGSGLQLVAALDSALAGVGNPRQAQALADACSTVGQRLKQLEAAAASAGSRGRRRGDGGGQSAEAAVSDVATDAGRLASMLRGLAPLGERLAQKTWRLESGLPRRQASGAARCSGGGGGGAAGDAAAARQLPPAAALACLEPLALLGSLLPTLLQRLRPDFEDREDPRAAAGSSEGHEAGAAAPALPLSSEEVCSLLQWPAALLPAAATALERLAAGDAGAAPVQLLGSFQAVLNLLEAAVGQVADMQYVKLLAHNARSAGALGRASLRPSRFKLQLADSCEQMRAGMLAQPVLDRLLRAAIGVAAEVHRQQGFQPSLGLWRSFFGAVHAFERLDSSVRTMHCIAMEGRRPPEGLSAALVSPQHKERGRQLAELATSCFQFALDTRRAPGSGSTAAPQPLTSSSEPPGLDQWKELSEGVPHTLAAACEHAAVLEAAAGMPGGQRALGEQLAALMQGIQHWWQQQQQQQQGEQQAGAAVGDGRQQQGQQGLQQRQEGQSQEREQPLTLMLGQVCSVLRVVSAALQLGSPLFGSQQYFDRQDRRHQLDVTDWLPLDALAAVAPLARSAAEELQRDAASSSSSSSSGGSGSGNGSSSSGGTNEGNSKAAGWLHNVISRWQMAFEHLGGHIRLSTLHKLEPRAGWDGLEQVVAAVEAAVRSLPAVTVATAGRAGRSARVLAEELGKVAEAAASRGPFEPRGYGSGRFASAVGAPAPPSLLRRLLLLAVSVGKAARLAVAAQQQERQEERQEEEERASSVFQQQGQLSSLAWLNYHTTMMGAHCYRSMTKKKASDHRALRCLALTVSHTEAAVAAALPTPVEDPSLSPLLGLLQRHPSRPRPISEALQQELEQAAAALSHSSAATGGDSGGQGPGAGTTAEAASVSAPASASASAAATAAEVAVEGVKALGMLRCSHLACTNLAGSSEGDLPSKKCASCLTCRFCCAACQVAAWPAHKPGCRLVKARREQRKAAAEAAAADE